MVRKIRMVLITLWHWLTKGRNLSISGFQDLAISTVIMIDHGKMALGKRTKTLPNTGFYVCEGELIIGDRTSFNRNCMIACRDKIHIGDHCAFGPNTVIYDHDHRFDHDGFYADEYKTAPVIIENGCWVGANVTILRGTHISRGCVIGAGTIVRGEIPAHSLVYSSSRELIMKRL